MTRRPGFRAASLAVLLASGALLAGCASAPTRFFTLDPVGPAQPLAAAYAGPPVKVLAVNIPPALDREELVSENMPGEVRVHDLEHWEAPLGLTARQVLVQDLAGRLPAGAVLGPASPGGDGVATLSIDIVSFRAGPDGAQMQASWNAALPAASGPLVFRSPLMTLRGPGAPLDGAATAQAFSFLLGQISDQIAAVLPTQVQALAAARALATPRAQTSTQTTQTRSTRQF
ncbi:membrane integrity-associated transporter subunit PqiC [Caulobacter sp. S45]|uniref:PqiC family protein n=1 Tax=Caulobacter sp. S45 TaxID=1641861 RepID=UPI00157656DD|nr:ABC-type transport auxiliary lipoprotein family protein [Caulobacter sp. S45]